MDNNRYLKEAIISESARGGQAYYRAKHHGANAQSVHLADLRELRQAKAHRVLRVKLFAMRKCSDLRWSNIHDRM